MVMLLMGAIENAGAEVQPLSVSGNKILIGGQTGSMAGMSLSYSNTGFQNEKFYNPEVVSWLKQDWNANIVRVLVLANMIGDVTEDPTGNKKRIKAVIDAAIANDMYVVVAWEEIILANPNELINFYQDMARSYGNTNNIIYEFIHTNLTSDWNNYLKPYEQQIVNAIRAIDPDNLIIAGTPNFSTRPDIAALNPLTGKNIAYEIAPIALQSLVAVRSYALTALNAGAALFASEFNLGFNNSPTINFSEADAWVYFLKTNEINTVGFSIEDRNNGFQNALIAKVNPNGNWTNNQLTASGAYQKDMISNWEPLHHKTVVVDRYYQSLFKRKTSIR
jgi:endoglucanase